MSAFHEEMERRFGTDKALGVVAVLWDGSGKEASITVPIDDADKLPQHIRDTFDCQSEFPDGTSAICCTNYAIQIFKAMPGRVRIFGFANEDNPTSRVAREELHPGGHDFAVVDDRYIVDPWLRLVLGEKGPIVFDMHDEVQAAIALDNYGPRSCWRAMVEAETFALSLQ